MNDELKLFPKGIFRQTLLFLIILAFASFNIYEYLERFQSANHNLLIPGETAHTGTIQMEINNPISLSGMSSKQIEELRTKVVNQNSRLIAAPYHPSTVVFSRIKSTLPWVSEAAFMFLDSGPNSGIGPSHEAIYIQNPMLLIGAEFRSLATIFSPIQIWSDAVIKKVAAGHHNFPLSPRISSINWNPINRSGEVTYEVSEFISKLKGNSSKDSTLESILWQPVAVNALDFNFKYFRIDPEHSKGLAFTDAASGYNLISDYFLGPDPICKIAGGCNRRRGTGILIELRTLPATAVFQIWRKKMDTIHKSPDCIFRVSFN